MMSMASTIASGQASIQELGNQRRFTLSRCKGGAQRLLAEFGIFVLRWRLSSKLLASFLQWRISVLLASPWFHRQVLRRITLHPKMPEAVTTFLLMPGSEIACSQVLRKDEAIADIGRLPGATDSIARLLGRPGLGTFLKRFLVNADTGRLETLLRHEQTPAAVAEVIIRADATLAAKLAGEDAESMARAMGDLVRRPSMAVWTAEFVHSEGVAEWLSRFLGDGGADDFVWLLLLQPGFDDFCERFCEAPGADVFVSTLLQDRGVRVFVTKLNRKQGMSAWFARITNRSAILQFTTSLMLQPGLDRLMVRLLLSRGNGAALRGMLEHWVRTDKSLPSVVETWASQPRAEKALARILLSRGFLDRFIAQRLLWQPGFAPLIFEAVNLIGLRVIQNSVVPLAWATLYCALLLQVQENWDKVAVDLIEAFPMLEQLEGIAMSEFLLTILGLL